MTVHVSFLLLFTVDVAVIVAVPTPTAVTTPELLTVATLELEVVQFTVWAAPLETLTVAVKLPVVLFVKFKLKVDGETVTELTTGSVPLVWLNTLSTHSG